MPTSSSLVSYDCENIIHIYWSDIELQDHRFSGPELSYLSHTCQQSLKCQVLDLCLILRSRTTSSNLEVLLVLGCYQSEAFITPWYICMTFGTQRFMFCSRSERIIFILGSVLSPPHWSSTETIDILPSLSYLQHAQRNNPISQPWCTISHWNYKES